MEINPRRSELDQIRVPMDPAKVRNHQEVAPALSQDVKTECCGASDGQTSTPVEKQNEGFQNILMKEEDKDEDYCGGILSPVDQKSEEIQKIVIKEEAEDENYVCRTDAVPESLLGDARVAGDAHMACSTSRLPPRSMPSRTSCAPPARPGKRKRSDSGVLSLVKKMLESAEEDRRQTRDQMQSLLQMVREQSQREADERQQLRAEAAETQRQQTAFLGGLLICLNKLVARVQVKSHPEVD